MITTFWAAIFVVFYAYLGYGILLFFLVQMKRIFRKKPVPEPASELPGVTFIVAAYNEEDWMADKDIAWSPVLNLKQAFDDPHVAERGMIGRDEAGGEVVGSPLLFTEEPASINSAAPAYGADTDEILTGLGYSLDEIDQLRGQGVV